MMPDDLRVLLGAIALALALAVVGYLVLGPRAPRLPVDRRRFGVEAGPSKLAGAATVATAKVDDVLRRRGGNGVGAALELAGVKAKAKDVVFLTIVAALVLGAGGLLLAGPLLGILLALLTPLGLRIWLSLKTTRRQKAFADQLDDCLQLMASSLRAGHSLLQALAAVAREAEEPASEEFTRIINETRVGRELADSLGDSARRMASEDFVWVTQAIAINREVGGNLAEVLDGVGHTIRERNQIRRQVKALSAEGKLSAIVLMVLPFGVTGFLLLTNGSYLMPFTQSALGVGMLVLSVVMLVVGALWMRKAIQIKF
jgi:tight adherence protein B